MFRFRRSIGTKNIKANIGKNGINSFTIRFGNISYNTRTKNVSVRCGHGVSYVFNIFGKNK